MVCIDVSAVNYVVKGTLPIAFKVLPIDGTSEPIPLMGRSWTSALEEGSDSNSDDSTEEQKNLRATSSPKRR
jgi:hypothetical protein